MANCALFHCLSLIMVVLQITASHSVSRTGSVDKAWDHSSPVNMSIRKLLNQYPEFNKTLQLMRHHSNESLSEWSVWSQCEACRQHRVRLSNINMDSMKVSINKIQERSCRRMHCRRLWHKKRSRTRMRIVRATLQFPGTHSRLGGNETFKYFPAHSNRNLINVHNKKRIWSKWSTWSKCNASCETYRYKVCRKPGRCFKGKKYESAHCYHPDSFCENYVNGLIGYHHYLTSFLKPTTTPMPTHIQVDKFSLKKFCGRPLRKQSMLKIKGGRNANRHLWPWHVAIVNARNEVFCSGTLIASRWVLTAGHCIKPELKVRINEYDLTRSDGEIEIPIIWYKRHSQFNTKNIDHDIGLLFMQKAVKTPVACLPTTQPIEREHCSILGWGATHSRSELGFPILQEAKIPIVDNDTCKSAYASYFISSNMFCAGLRSGQVDTCAGDSGGGLMCQSMKHSGRKKYRAFIVQGITSFGEGCGKRHRYGIYTNVANYYDWIHDVIQTHRAYALKRANLSRTTLSNRRPYLNSNNNL